MKANIFFLCFLFFHVTALFSQDNNMEGRYTPSDEYMGVSGSFNFEDFSSEKMVEFLELGRQVTKLTKANLFLIHDEILLV